jgi:KDO2-lipid IV(A) lauroyltransferase
MAKSKPVNFGYRVEALLWDGVQALFGAFKLEKASALGASLLQGIGPLTSPNKTALRNLRLAFPNESEAWRREVLKAMWAEFGRITGEFPHMHEFPARLADGRIVFEGREHIARARETGAVYIGGHFSNWEVTSVCLAGADPDCYFTYRPANNPIIDKKIIETRKSFGLTLQSAKGRSGGMALMRTLGRKGTVALMNDQKYNEGVAVPLFGHDCMTADGPTRLALRFKVPLAPLSGRRMGGVTFKVTAHSPIALDYDAPLEDAVLSGVKRVNAFMEARIREAPEQWFWVHRRWPKSAWIDAGVM